MNAVKLSCTVCHFALGWKEILSAENWVNFLSHFKKGRLATELLEKSVLERDYSAAEFRCLMGYGIDTSLHVEANIQELEDQQKEVVMRQQKAHLQEANVVLQRDAQLFRQFKAQKEMHECANATRRQRFKAEESHRNSAIVETQLAKNYPVRQMDNVDHIMPYVNSVIIETAEKAFIPKKAEDVVNVFFCQFLHPG